MQGIVIKSTGSWYTVLMSDGTRKECRIKGNFRLKGIKATNPIAVGDSVEIDLEGGEGMISDIHERKNYIIRRSTKLSKQWHIIAANIDRAFLVVTIALPKTSFGFMDRFLATAEAYNIPTTILFNKKDLHTFPEIQEELEYRMSIYQNIGYECKAVSSMDKNDMNWVKEQLNGKINLFCGHSGVGKSSIINAIDSTLKLKVGNISEVHFKGTHTTTFAEMHEVNKNTFIIDTPGIKEFGIIDMEKHELSHFFPEIFNTSRDCKFNTCLHVNEPKCAVLQAVENEVIAPSRYNSYISILNGEELIKEYE